MRRESIPGLVAIAAVAMWSPATSAGAQAAATSPAASSVVISGKTPEEVGEYLTIVGSCNDCHTQGWVESKGKIAPEDRFAGLNVGFRGEWGTVYGKNLRTVTQRQSEDHWVEVLKTSDGGDGHPPMPWWNTAQMSDQDLRAIYKYIKSLGPRTNGVPRSLPAGKEPTGPWIWVTPKTGP